MGMPSGIGKTYVKRQASSWGTAESSFSDTTDLFGTAKFIPSPKIAALVAEYMRGNFHAQPVVAGSREGMEFTLSKKLSGPSSTTPVANPAEHPDALLIKAILGASSIQGYSATNLATGGTISAINYTDGTLTTALSGQAVLVPYSGGRGWVWAKTINTAGSPDVITPACPLAVAPASSGTIYGSNVCYLTPDAPEAFTTQWRGGNANAGVRMRDCVMTGFKMAFKTNGQVDIDATVRTAYADILGGSTPAQYILPFPDLPTIFGANGSRFYSVQAGAQEAVPKVEIEMKQEVKPRGDMNQTDGYLGYDVTDRDITVTVWRTSNNMTTELDTVGSEIDAVQIDLCNIPGRAASILLRNAQISESKTWEDEDGVVMQKSVYKCRPTAADTAGGAPANSPFRIAFG